MKLIVLERDLLGFWMTRFSLSTIRHLGIVLGFPPFSLRSPVRGNLAAIRSMRFSGAVENNNTFVPLYLPHHRVLGLRRNCAWSSSPIHNYSVMGAVQIRRTGADVIAFCPIATSANAAFRPNWLLAQPD
jgi:hypothetical protein